MYVLGIDGGGTKTSAVIADERGTVYMQALEGSSNPNTLAKQEFEEVLDRLLSDLQQQNPEVFSNLAACFAGMSGVGESGRDIELTEFLKKRLPENAKVTVKNDAYNALYAGTLGNPGVVQIAGTGSITFGINYEDRKARCGGWGYLFDDAGSGYYFGKEALRSLFEEYDGRGPATRMTQKILSVMGAGEVPDLIGKIYGNEHPRSVISKLSPIVVNAAEAGDPVAKSIICAACEEMMKCIKACHRKLFPPDHPTVIVLSGGVFTNPTPFIWYLNELGKESLPNVVFREIRMAPVGGAVIGGLRTLGVNSLDEPFAEQMDRQLRK